MLKVGIKSSHHAHEVRASTVRQRKLQCIVKTQISTNCKNFQGVGIASLKLECTKIKLGIISNRRSERCGEYVNNFFTHRPSRASSQLVKHVNCFHSDCQNCLTKVSNMVSVPGGWHEVLTR